MSLRIKTLTLICLTVLILITLLYAFSQLILLRGYEDLEEYTVTENVQVALSALEDKIAFYHNTGMDWAHWDDTYTFIQDLNHAYIETNILNSVFEYYDLDFILFLNPAGEIVYSQGYDSERQEQVPVAASLRQFVVSNQSLLRPSDDAGHLLIDGVSGIVLLPENNLILAATPITPSNLQGDPIGALIWGRYLDKELVTALAAQTRLNLSVNRIAGSTTLNERIEAPAVTIQAVNGDFITGMTSLPDINGISALRLTVEIPRTIYQQGQRSIFYFLFSLILVGIILTGIMGLILERSVLSRVAYLSHFVSQIQATGDIASRVRMGGKDELTDLSTNINRMLDTLQAQEQIKLARDRAVESARLKAEILANVSHDARTPLTVILIRTEMMIKGIYGALHPKQLEILNSITINAHQLLGFINNMLEGARLESGHLKLQIAEFTPANLLKTVTMTLQPLAVLKHLRFETELSDDVPERLYGDEKRLESILTNLASNSIKFTGQGAVEIKIYRPDPEHWALEVKDSGAGIAPEHQQQIFVPFWQVDGSTTRSASSGVGLGLSIVHQLTELMGGTIAVKSTVGEGSVFTVILPLLLPPPARGNQI